MIPQNSDNLVEFPRGPRLARIPADVFSNPKGRIFLRTHGINRAKSIYYSEHTTRATNCLWPNTECWLLGETAQSPQDSPNRSLAAHRNTCSDQKCVTTGMLGCSQNEMDIYSINNWLVVSNRFNILQWYTVVNFLNHPKRILKKTNIFIFFNHKSNHITYLPHEAVAEVSKDKEPIGRECAEFNWFESQLMSDSNELRVKWFGCHLIWDSIDLVVNWFEIQMIWLSIDVRFKWFWLSVDLNFKWCGCQLIEIQVIRLSIDLRFKWFGCQSIWDSSDLVVNWLRFKWFGCQLIWDSSDLVVNRFEIQAIWLSIDLRFKWFGCQSMCASNDFGCLLIWTSSDVVVNWFEIQVIRLWIDLRFKWFGCQSIWDSNEFVVNWLWDSSDLDVNWFEIQMIWLSIDVRFKWFWLSVDLNFKWCGCQLIEIQVIRLSIDLRFKWFGCQSIWDSSDLVVNWFEIQMIWLSIDVCFKWFWLSVDLNFKWCGCQLIWDSSDSVVNWSEIQVIWLSIDLRFKWVCCQLIMRFKWFGCQMIWGSSDLVVNWCAIQRILSNEAFLRDFLQKWSFETQKRSISARLPSKSKLWSCKTKLFCETSFKKEAVKLKNEAFVRDFLQKARFEAEKRSFCARLPSNMKLWRSKTKLFCETSLTKWIFEAQNEAFLRDFLQKWSSESQKRSISARLPSKMTCRPDAWPQNSILGWTGELLNGRKGIYYLETIYLRTYKWHISIM